MPESASSDQIDLTPETITALAAAIREAGGVKPLDPSDSTVGQASDVPIGSSVEQQQGAAEAPSIVRTIGRAAMIAAATKGARIVAQGVASEIRSRADNGGSRKWKVGAWLSEAVAGRI